MLKFLRRQIRAVGFRRFFLAFSLIAGGLIWQFVQLGGGGIDVVIKQVLGFWPVFWAIWMGAGLVIWIVSGFKNLAALLFGLIGGGFMAETILPGVVINKENMPWFFILTGLMILMGRKIRLGGALYNYSYNDSGGGYFGGYFGNRGGAGFSGKTLLQSWFGIKPGKRKHKSKGRKRSGGPENSGHLEDANLVEGADKVVKNSEKA